VWKATVDGDARAVAVTATRVYLAGHYDHICQTDALIQNSNQGFSCQTDGPIHRHIAAFQDTGTSGLLDGNFHGNANTNEGPYTIGIGPSGLYVGGNFTRISDTAGVQGRPQGGFALFPVQ